MAWSPPSGGIDETARTGTGVAVQRGEGDVRTLFGNLGAPLGHALPLGEIPSVKDRLEDDRGLWGESRLGIRFDAGSKEAECGCRREAYEITREETFYAMRALRKTGDEADGRSRNATKRKGATGEGEGYGVEEHTTQRKQARRIQSPIVSEAIFPDSS